MRDVVEVTDLASASRRAMIAAPGVSLRREAPSVSHSVVNRSYAPRVDEPHLFDMQEHDHA